MRHEFFKFISGSHSNSVHIRKPSKNDRQKEQQIFKANPINSEIRLKGREGFFIRGL